MRMTQEEKDKKHPQIMFTCSWCGETVLTDNASRMTGVDKRKRFCSVRCEHKYWKKPRKDQTKLTVLRKSEVFRDVNKYDK